MAVEYCYSADNEAFNYDWQELLEHDLENGATIREALDLVRSSR
jgi:hypothetical protein